MKKVIIFTSCLLLNKTRPGFPQSRADVRLLEDNNVIYFNENSLKFQIPNSLNEEGLYFILDEISEKDFEKLNFSINAAETYLLKHRKPAYSLGKFSENIKQGEHETNGSYYPQLLAIICDDKGEKVDRIIDDIFEFNSIREANLNLLISRFPGKNSNDLDDLLKQHSQTPSDSDLKNKSYDEKLTLLRIALLGS